MALLSNIAPIFLCRVVSGARKPIYSRGRPGYYYCVPLTIRYINFGLTLIQAFLSIGFSRLGWTSV